MKTLHTDISRFTVSPQRKDAEFKNSVETVRTMINADRAGTKWKPLSYMATFMKLKRAGYDSPHKISVLLGSVKDADVPVRALFYRLKV